MNAASRRYVLWLYRPETGLESTIAPLLGVDPNSSARIRGEAHSRCSHLSRLGVQGCPLHKVWHIATSKGSFVFLHGGLEPLFFPGFSFEVLGGAEVVLRHVNSFPSVRYHERVVMFLDYSDPGFLRNVGVGILDSDAVLFVSDREKVCRVGFFLFSE